MTASTEKEEYEEIYEAIKRRQAAYAAAHPGRYYLLPDYEMDDIASYHQIKTLERKAEERKKTGKLLPTPPVPKRSLVELLLDCGFVDGRKRKNES